MNKSLSLILFALLFNVTGYGQELKAIIYRDISSINYVPYGQYRGKDWKENDRINKDFRKSDPAYHEILALDTLAIPYLVDLLTDTTDMYIRIPCCPHFLKKGDIAFALLNDIIPIPFHAVTGNPWDTYTCDSVPDNGWVYLNNYRTQFQKELKTFFAARPGKMWVKALKDNKIKSTERAQLIKRFNNQPVTHDATTTQDDTTVAH